MSIKIENLNHIYDKGSPYELLALDHINLNIEDGEIIGLIGHTGSGKSTLIQHLNGLLRPTEGSLTINGTTITNEKKNLRKLRQEVGIVFQYPEYQLFEETVAKDIAFGPKNIGIPENEVESTVRNALSQVGLSYEEFAEKSPFELSGGQKRKVAIAGVLAMKPKILILDEPTAGLDPKSRDELIRHIKSLHKEEKMTIIFVTHSMDEAVRLADRLVVMHKGRIVQNDRPELVFQEVAYLQSIGLDVPELSKLVHMLNKKGFDLDPNLMTLNEVKLALENALRSK